MRTIDELSKLEHPGAECFIDTFLEMAGEELHEIEIIFALVARIPIDQADVIGRIPEPIRGAILHRVQPKPEKLELHWNCALKAEIVAMLLRFVQEATSHLELVHFDYRSIPIMPHPGYVP